MMILWVVFFFGAKDILEKNKNIIKPLDLFE